MGTPTAPSSSFALARRPTLTVSTSSSEGSLRGCPWWTRLRGLAQEAARRRKWLRLLPVGSFGATTPRASEDHLVNARKKVPVASAATVTGAPYEPAGAARGSLRDLADLLKMR